MSKLSADNLYHYTSKFEWILNIIQNGFEYRSCKEKLPLTGFSSSIFSFPGIVVHTINPKVVCFCDIPFSLVSDHINQYGEYCIGLTKDWGLKNGISPIRYVHYNTPELQDDTFYLLKACAENYHRFSNSMLMMINTMLKGTEDFDGITDEDIDELPEKWKRIISQMDCEYFNMLKFTQTYIGNMRSYEDEWEDIVTKNKTKRRFYDEREWRALKTKEEQTHLEFDWNDITEIILKDINEQKRLIDLLYDKFKVDSKLAKSKIRFISEIIKSDDES